MFEKNDELPNIHGANQMLPIQVATQQGHKLMVKFLNKIQESLEEMDSNKLSAIASKNGSSEEIFENVASHPRTNQADDPVTMEIRQKLSHAAMYNDWIKAYEDIFKGDPYKNSKYLTAKISEDGSTALHLATLKNSIGFVNELVKAMFEKNRWLPSIHGHWEMLPIHAAAQNGHKEMVKFLYGIQGPLQEIDSNILFLNQKNRVSLRADSWTIYINLEELSIAASSNDWNRAYNAQTKSFMFFEELLKYMKKEYLAIKNADGNTAFFLIAESGDVRLAKKMFEKDGELPIIRGERQMLPIHKAAKQNHKLMVDFLYGIQGPLERMDNNKLSSKYN
ncbi:hypothetical protein Pint_12279 [Pistacia integerrima]|uniref:Uncharacterized protein n=1 Tax=Pistacia integerrima TaxID=434235 RepID=A0ACC0XI61_9ROSI|nr:hypothetical protein Pint_12279 [Pistacia integerrima]